MSTAGGISKAVGRGIERGCEAIQIFNQSPRMWRPTSYGEEDFAAFREAAAEAGIQSVLVHCVYLVNTASEDPDLRAKSLAALTHALRVGDAIGASGVVLHAGSALRGPLAPAIERSGELIAAALGDSERAPLHLENTAGAGSTLGRSFEELAALIEAAGGGPRLGACLDSCHLLATGYDVRTPESLAAVVEEFDAALGLERLGSLHVNDSKTPLGSNRDRHAPLGEGELGEDGCATFLSEPAFDGLPTVFEGPGTGGAAVELADMDLMRELRQRGLASRSS